MKQETQTRPASDPSLRPLLRSLILELAVYIPLVVLYFLLALRFANDYLTQLYQTHTVSYAIIAITAIVVQAVLLERLTAWLLRRFGLR